MIDSNEVTPFLELRFSSRPLISAYEFGDIPVAKFLALLCIGASYIPPQAPLCTVNPLMFREGEYEPKQVISPKRVLVAGEGHVGMTVAQVSPGEGIKLLYTNDVKS